MLLLAEQRFPRIFDNSKVRLDWLRTICYILFTTKYAVAQFNSKPPKHRGIVCYQTFGYSNVATLTYSGETYRCFVWLPISTFLVLSTSSLQFILESLPSQVFGANVANLVRGNSLKHKHGIPKFTIFIKLVILYWETIRSKLLSVNQRYTKIFTNQKYTFLSANCI